MPDTLQSFMLEQVPVRGALVRLHDSLQTIVEQHAYPQQISALLAEALSASLLLVSTIKYQGQLIMQYQSEGAVELLVVKSNHKQEICGMARWQDPLPKHASHLIGHGELVVTVLQDANVKQYQSIIPLSQAGLAQSLQEYFMQSEQLPSSFWLSGHSDQAYGMVLQKMPDTSGEPFDYVAFIANIEQTNIDFSLSNEVLLQQLFAEHDVRLFEKKDIAFKCSCSMEKMKQAVLTFGEAEARKVLAEKSNLVVACDFCNQEYAFSKSEVDAIFSA